MINKLNWNFQYSKACIIIYNFGRNLLEKLHNWKTIVNHSEMKMVHDSYEIELPENVYLKEGECYSLEIKSNQDVKFKLFNE